MKLIVIEGNDIEIICLFEDNELEQMLVQDEVQRKPLPVRKNNFISNSLKSIKFIQLYGKNN